MEHLDRIGRPYGWRLLYSMLISLKMNTYRRSKDSVIGYECYGVLTRVKPRVDQAGKKGVSIMNTVRFNY
jgi:hypothetical protein